MCFGACRNTERVPTNGSDAGKAAVVMDGLSLYCDQVIRTSLYLSSLNILYYDVNDVHYVINSEIFIFSCLEKVYQYSRSKSRVSIFAAVVVNAHLSF